MYNFPYYVHDNGLSTEHMQSLVLLLTKLQQQQMYKILNVFIFPSND